MDYNKIKCAYHFVKYEVCRNESTSIRVYLFQHKVLLLERCTFTRSNWSIFFYLMNVSLVVVFSPLNHSIFFKQCVFSVHYFQNSISI